MRRALPHLLALVLAAGAAGLVACGGNGPRAGIPAARASDLEQQLADVQSFVDRGACSGLDGQLRQVDEGIDGLPSSTSDRLEQRLRDGAQRLADQARQECAENKRDTQTTDTQHEEPTTTTQVPTTTTTEPPPETEPTQTEAPPQTQPPARTQPQGPPPDQDGGQDGGQPPGGTQDPGSGGTSPQVGR